MTRDDTRRSSRVWRIALVMSLALAALGAWNWALRPDQALHWLPGMLFVPVVWYGLRLYARLARRRTGTQGQLDQAAIRRYGDAVISIVLVCAAPMLVVLALGIWPALFGTADPEIARRIKVFSAAAAFVVAGNVLPKILTPLVLLPRGRAGRQQEARRFLGLAMVILGLTMAAAAIRAPLDLLLAVSRWTLVAFGLALGAAIGWMNVASSQPEAQ